MVDELVKLKVKKQNIYVLDNLKNYDLGSFCIKPIDTYHDVPNTSYLIDFKPIKAYYATDTFKLDYLDCLKNLDYYFIERNYSEQEMEQREQEEWLKNRIKNSHLSEEETNKFLMEMMGDNSQYVYCHEHKEKGEKNENY